MAGVKDIWEPGILAVKTEGFSIKRVAAHGDVVTKKFSSRSKVTIPIKHPVGQSLHSSADVEYLLRTTGDSKPLRREKERRGCCSSSRAFLTRPLEGSSSRAFLTRPLEGLGAAMAETKQPALTKVDQLRPATASLTIVVKVLSSKLIATRGRSDGPPPRQLRLAECLVGDETGIIVFTARRDQVDLMKPDSTVILRNARVDIFKGSMRLAVDKWGGIEVTDPAEFSVREDCNFSLLEFEEVKVVED